MKAFQDFAAEVCCACCQNDNMSFGMRLYHHD